MSNTPPSRALTYCPCSRFRAPGCHLDSLWSAHSFKDFPLVDPGGVKFQGFFLISIFKFDSNLLAPCKLRTAPNYSAPQRDNGVGGVATGRGMLTWRDEEHENHYTWLKCSNSDTHTDIYIRSRSFTKGDLEASLKTQRLPLVV